MGEGGEEELYSNFLSILLTELWTSWPYLGVQRHQPGAFPSGSVHVVGVTGKEAQGGTRVLLLSPHPSGLPGSSEGHLGGTDSPGACWPPGARTGQWEGPESQLRSLARRRPLAGRQPPLNL